MNQVKLKVNGVLHQVVVDSRMTLLDFLRDRLHLTGPKQSCDQAGQCGACTVIVDGKAVRSCLVRVARLDGADVLTVEGLGTPENPHLVQEAFVLAGAIQCGFCTPGMIMATKALLDENSNPTNAEIKQALRHNLCRCTGYVKIIEAVKLAGRFLRGETTPEEIRPDPKGPKIGVSHPRPTAMAMACGVAKYTEDILIPGALELAVVRSPHPHALIKNIDYTEAEKMPGVAGVITAKDIKGSNCIMGDRPVICDTKVRCIGDPVAAVAAETREQALAAARAVKVDYELLPNLDSPQKAMTEGAEQVHAGQANLCYSMPLVRGDAAGALEQAAGVVESRFTTQINHQASMEREAGLAYLEGEGEEAQLVVIGRSINIHLHAMFLKEALGWENIRYEEAQSGGQFGIKLEITSESLAGAAALHFKRAVRYMPSLSESLLMTSKRHPYEMQVRMGADQDGHITALEMDMLIDNGAYNSIGDMCLRRSLMMLTSAYHIPHIKARGRLVYTNNPWGGAARGAGPPQSNFAVECVVNMLAEKVGIDPLQFRLQNSLQPGQIGSTGVTVEQWPFRPLCEAMKPHYERACRDAREQENDQVKRGVGLAAVGFGIGDPADESLVALELDPDGGVTIYAGVADPGEGNDSMLTQLAAHSLELPLDKVRLQIRTTENTTMAGFAAGSRMTFMGGGALLDAVEQLKKALNEAGAKSYQELKEAGYPTRFTGKKVSLQQDVPPQEGMDPETGQGASFATHVLGLQMAELEVNMKSGAVQVLKVTTAVDAGTVINPHNLEGQLEGGADQGVGLALREEYVAGHTKDWVTFKFPRIEQSFEMESILHETPRVPGTNGSTGIGELTLLPTAPAVISAIKDATGVWLCHLPATPAKVKAALEGTS